MRFSVGTAFCPVDELLPLAKAADELGYHGLAIPDHVVNLETLRTPYPYTEDGERRWGPFTPWPDPWVLVGAMSSITTTLNFYTSVYVLPLRNPYNVAKAIGTAAVLSANRVQLGIGMGWCEEEFELGEQPFAKRGKRADEMIELLKTLWSEGWVEFHGEFYDLPKAEMEPTPTQPVPIFVGGMSEAAFRRAARNDGWIADYVTIEESGQIARKLEGYRQELGKADEPFSIIASLKDALTVDQFAEAEQGGVTDILTMPWAYYGGFKVSLDEKIAGMERFKTDVVDHLPG